MAHTIDKVLWIKDGVGSAYTWKGQIGTPGENKNDKPLCFWARWKSAVRKT